MAASENERHHYVLLAEEGLRNLSTNTFFKSFVKSDQYLKCRSVQEDGYFLETIALGQLKNAENVFVELKIPIQYVFCIVRAVEEKKSIPLGFDVEAALDQGRTLKSH